MGQVRVFLVPHGLDLQQPRTILDLNRKLLLAAAFFFCFSGGMLDVGNSQINVQPAAQVLDNSGA